MKRFDYQATAVVCGIKLEERIFWSASPKRAGATFMEDVLEDLIRGRGALGGRRSEAAGHLRDLFGGGGDIPIEVQRLEIVDGGGDDDTVRRAVGKSRHYTWNGHSTSTRKGYIPALKETP